ncbi:MAG: hypothetical protein JST68_06775 [Bacteroidetes bacterium]|nr:hypothetical protein [Bacteroidota bacterium]
MNLTKNTHKVLVAVLLTVGTVVLSMGGMVGHSVLYGQASVGKVQEVVERDGVILPAHGNFEKDGPEAVENEVVEKAHGEQLHSEIQKLQPHKNLYKRSRNRSGSELYYTTYSLDSYHPRLVRLPERYEASIHTAILVTSSLRGPPCA